MSKALLLRENTENVDNHKHLQQPVKLKFSGTLYAAVTSETKPFMWFNEINRVENILVEEILYRLLVTKILIMQFTALKCPLLSSQSLDHLRR